MSSAQYATIQIEAMSERKLDIGGILDRMKVLYELETDSDLARFLEMSPSGIATWRRRQSIDLTLLVECCVFRLTPRLKKPNIHWLITGEGIPAPENPMSMIRDAVNAAIIAETGQMEKRVIEKLKAQGVIQNEPDQQNSDV